MASHDIESQRAAQAAIDEAARTVAESSRRTTEQAQQATRTLLDQSAEMSRNLFSTWTNTAEAVWRAVFELQNAQSRAALSYWQTLAQSSQSGVQLLQQWDGITRQAQQAWIESLQASLRSVATTAEQTVRSAR